MSSRGKDSSINLSISMPESMLKKLDQKAEAAGHLDRSAYVRATLAEKWRVEEATLFDLTAQQREEFIRALSRSELWKQNLRALAGLFWECENGKSRKRREEG